MRREEARSTKDLLAEAGFRMKSADTPEKLACLKTMTPLELATLSKDDALSIVTLILTLVTACM